MCFFRFLLKELSIPISRLPKSDGENLGAYLIVVYLDSMYRFHYQQKNMCIQKSSILNSYLSQTCYCNIFAIGVHSTKQNATYIG